MVSISVITTTARDDYPIIGMPKTHIFGMLIETLNRQSFKDFELILVDSLFNLRRNSPFLSEAKFPIKHTPPKASPWVDVAMFHACNDINTAILYANGELLVKIDDCQEIFSQDHLKRIWEWYKRGFLAQQTFQYYFRGEPIRYSKEFVDDLIREGNFQNPTVERNTLSAYKDNEVIFDTRYSRVSGETKIISHEWFYGVWTLPLSDALVINGSDENFDGCEGINDCDLGLRLEMKGSMPFLFDKNLLLIEHFHKELSREAIKRSIYFKSDYALYTLNKNNRRIRANTHVLTDDEIEYVKKEAYNLPYVKYDQEWFNYWKEHQRIFNLREMRLKV